MMSVTTLDSRAQQSLAERPARPRLVDEASIDADRLRVAHEATASGRVVKESLEGATSHPSATSMLASDTQMRRRPLGSDDPLFPYGTRYINPAAEITFWGDNI